MKQDKALQESLDKLAAGLPLPETGADDPAVETARLLTASRSALDITPSFVRASRRRVLAQLPARTARRSPFSSRWAAQSGWRSPILQGALLGLLVFMIFLSGNRLASASPAWIPGDLLYPLKPLAEDVAVTVSLSSQRDAELHIEYANRRLVEIQSLALEGRYERIPATVAEFDRQVTHALVAVSQLSGSRQNDARRLAQRLDASLSSQVGVVSVLSKAAPEVARGPMQRLLSIAADGMAAVRFIVPLESGSNHFLGLSGAPAW